jgi:hypothetical protein
MPMWYWSAGFNSMWINSQVVAVNGVHAGLISPIDPVRAALASISG